MSSSGIDPSPFATYPIPSLVVREDNRHSRAPYSLQPAGMTPNHSSESWLQQVNGFLLAMCVSEQLLQQALLPNRPLQHLDLNMAPCCVRWRCPIPLLLCPMYHSTPRPRQPSLEQQYQTLASSPFTDRRSSGAVFRALLQSTPRPSGDVPLRHSYIRSREPPWYSRSHPA